MQQGAGQQEELLAKCPFCGYSLEGLPVRHKCPECGRPFDRQWRVFGNLSRWEQSKPTWRVVSLGMEVAAISWLIYFYSGILAESWTGFLLVALFAAGIPLGLRRRFARPKCFVIVEPRAVALMRREGTVSDRYPLTRITEAEADSWHRLVIWAGSREVVRIALCGGWAEAERCAVYINSLVDKLDKPVYDMPNSRLLN